jgi:carboxylesterase type B
VIIWIHGGWLQLGDPFFDKRMHPYELISKDGYGLDVVVLAPGYRLNVFGFLGADADGLLPGNWGFWDQRCAIEWISKNVHHFGGNNQNVTLGGVSAGAYSTEVQLFYDLFQAANEGKKPLFQRVWMSSNAIPVRPYDILTRLLLNPSKKQAHNSTISAQLSTFPSILLPLKS